MKYDSVKSLLLLSAVGAAGYLAWRAYSSGAGALAGLGQSVQQAIDQGAANVQSAWKNNIASPFQRGQDFMAGIPAPVSEKAWLYSDYAYTGKDASGQLVTDGEWYGDAVARRYDAEQRAAGAAPAATSNNGAAFGVYPAAYSGASIRAAAIADARQIDRIMERQQNAALLAPVYDDFGRPIYPYA